VRVATVSSWVPSVISAGRRFGSRPGFARAIREVPTVAGHLTSGNFPRREQRQIELIMTICCICSESAANTLAMVAGLLATDNVSILLPFRLEPVSSLSFILDHRTPAATRQLGAPLAGSQ
jgi:hypothetical protein